MLHCQRLLRWLSVGDGERLLVAISAGLREAGLAAATTKPPSTAGAPAAAGDDTAGGLDDGDQRDDVVGLQAGLDHEVDLAHGQHAVGVAVAAVADQPRGVGEPAEGVELVGRVREHAGERRVHRRPSTGRRRPGATSGAVRQPAWVNLACPPTRGERLVEVGLMHPPGHRCTPSSSRPSMMPHNGDPLTNDLGAVDRVDEPAVAARRARWSPAPRRRSGGRGSARRGAARMRSSMPRSASVTGS